MQRHLQKREEDKRNSLVSKMKMKAAALTLALALPLVSCATIGSQIRSTSGNCNLDYKTSSATVTYQNSRLELDIPDQMKLDRPLIVSCQDERFVAVSRKYIWIAIGEKDVSNGRQMLGVFNSDKTFYPQNAIFLSLAKAGEAKSAEVNGPLVRITTDEGEVYIVNVDKPASPIEIK